MSFISIRSTITSFVFLALLIPINPAFSLDVKETVKVKTVSGGNLNVRYGPNGKKISSIKSGTPVQILTTTGTGRNFWSRVRWAGKVGWVRNDFIKIAANVDLGKTYQVDTKSTELTVRKGAGRNHQAIRALPKAAAGIKILKLQKAADGYWANISQGGKTGWVSAKYLKVAATQKNTNSVSRKQYYTVVASDTLYAVQRKIGSNWKKIASLNNISPPYALTLGQRLELPTNNRAQLTQCYKKTEGNDLTVIQLVQNNQRVSGYYAWIPKDRDGAQGSFTGNISGNKIIAQNTYLIEGSTQTEEVAFKLENNALIQGLGELIDKKEGLVFKNPNALSWTDRFAKVDCSSVSAAVNSAKQVANDIQNNSTTDTEVETKTSSESDIYTVTYNKYGAILESTKDKKIYVNNNCGTSSSKYGKGTWGFANGGFNIDFKNRHIGFPRQELNIPDSGKCRF